MDHMDLISQILRFNLLPTLSTFDLWAILCIFAKPLM